MEIYRNIGNLNGEKVVKTIHENELQNKCQTEFRIEKVIKENSDELYVIVKNMGNSR